MPIYTALQKQGNFLVQNKVLLTCLHKNGEKNLHDILLACRGKKNYFDMRCQTEAAEQISFEIQKVERSTQTDEDIYRVVGNH